MTPGYYQIEPCGCRFRFLTDAERKSERSICMLNGRFYDRLHDTFYAFTCSPPTLLVGRIIHSFLVNSAKLDFNR